MGEALISVSIFLLGLLGSPARGLSAMMLPWISEEKVPPLDWLEAHLSTFPPTLLL